VNFSQLNIAEINSIPLFRKEILKHFDDLKHWKGLLNRTQVVLLSEAMTKDIQSTLNCMPFGFTDHIVERIDLPFDNVYIESVSDDLALVQTAEFKQRVPFVGIFLYRCSGIVKAMRVFIRPNGEYMLTATDTLTNFDLNIIKAINSKSNGISKATINKRNKFTGDARIKDIVFCDRKKSLKKSELKIDGKPFIYSHEFDVRGHWRKVSHIGKSPDGDYCIKGATWVNSFKKGKGDYVKKTRIFV